MKAMNVRKYVIRYCAKNAAGMLCNLHREVEATTKREAIKNIRYIEKIFGYNALYCEVERA